MSSLRLGAVYLRNKSTSVILGAIPHTVVGKISVFRLCPGGLAVGDFKREGEAMVELDQFKSILATYTEPLVEVRDSL